MSLFHKVSIVFPPLLYPSYRERQLGIYSPVKTKTLKQNLQKPRGLFFE